VLIGHTNWINAVAFSPDGATIASASVGGMIRLWHSGTGQHLHTLHGHSANVETVAFSPDGIEVISGAFDGTIKL
jgi:WD40 repeat protein